MLRLQERGGWVDEPWETPDPDDVHDDLKVLMTAWTGGGVDSFWSQLLNLDPEELGKLRRHQMMALARYGRQSLLDWEDRETNELRSWYEELRLLMEAESTAGKVVEDR